MRILLIIAVLGTAACTGPERVFNIPTKEIHGDLSATHGKGR